MCRKFNDLNVPEIGFHEVRATQVQEEYCTTLRHLERCDLDCDNCIYFSENLEDYLELYEKQMSEVL